MRERTWLNWAMHVGFYLLLAASALRLVARHGMVAQTVTSLAVCGLLALAYAAGVVFWDRLGRRRPLWLGVVAAIWLVLVILAPSFSWCAVPLLFVCLRLMDARGFAVAAAALTVVVIAAQLKIAQELDPSLILAPIGIAAMTAVIFGELQRESAARQLLIDDLISTRGTLADSRHRTGVLEERERLAREIHDTLAQGLTSMGILLQAADRKWDADPAQARAHVRRAAAAAAENLDEARRFVRDLQPPGLVGGSLPDALARLCESDDTGPRVRFRQEGEEYPLEPDVQAALLRVAQAALANVRDHAGTKPTTRTGTQPGTPGTQPGTPGTETATQTGAETGAQKGTEMAGVTATVTLAYLDGEVTLDVFDDGVGFVEPAPAPGRGYGLRAMRDRLAEVGGVLVVESVPGEGTAVAARVPAGWPR